MKMDDVVAREHVMIILDDGTRTDTGLCPEEILATLAKGVPEEIAGQNGGEVAKTFVTACEKNMMRAFIQNYDFWEDRLQSGYWDPATFQKKVGSMQGNPFAQIPDGVENWRKVKRAMLGNSEICIDDVSALKTVLIRSNEGETDTGMYPAELAKKLLDTKEDIEGYSRLEVTKAFVHGCEMNIMKAFLPEYDEWERSLKTAYEETADVSTVRRVQEEMRSADPYAPVGGKKQWEKLRKNL